MQSILCKAAIAVWFVATNVIAAAAVNAATHYPQFAIQYYLLADALLITYFWGWHYRIRRERGKSVNESVLRYYWRTRLSKGRF
jgi:hypothetical protein